MACSPCAFPATITITTQEVVILTLLIAAVVLILFSPGLISKLIGLILIAIAVFLYIGKVIVIAI